MRALVYVEVHQGQVAGTTRELVMAARQLVGTEGRVEALLLHSTPDALVPQLGDVDEVVVIRNDALANYSSEAHQACLDEAVKQRGPDVVLLGYTAAGLDLGAATAARHALPMASYCVSVQAADGGIACRCQIYGGKLEAKIDLATPALVLMTPGSYRESEQRQPPAIVEMGSPDGLRTLKMKVLGVQAPDPNAVDITKAKIIVCVGRGIGSKDSIDEAAELANLLGGEVAGSRPVIDAGWLPKERQVGKSGRKVKPRLYLALGVSGAPEHLEGMADSELIVAINSDANAPMFSSAQFGATVDLFDFIEAMKSSLNP
jgi:electron transfer flavoprotein alpha subunit